MKGELDDQLHISIKTIQCSCDLETNKFKPPKSKPHLLAQNNPAHSGITFGGRPHLTLGGVGRNLATAIQYLGHKPIFITSLAEDKLGSFALRELQEIGLTKEQLRINRFGLSPQWASDEPNEPASSSCFALVLMDSVSGQCEYMIANLEAAQAIDREAIKLNSELIEQSPLLVMDANLMGDTIEFIIELCNKMQVPIFLEPTDVVALPRLVDSLKRLQASQSDSLSSLLCLSPNLVELTKIVELFEGSSTGQVSASVDSLTQLDEVNKMVERLMNIHLPQLRCLLVTMDRRGVLVAARTKSDTREDLERLRLMIDANHDESQKGILNIKRFEPPKLVEKPVSAAGAGDSFAAGFISGLLMDLNLAESIERGFKASALTLNDSDNVSTRLREL